jgi:hypothetical protein
MWKPVETGDVSTGSWIGLGRRMVESADGADKRRINQNTQLDI